MPLSILIHLEALDAAMLEQFTGRGVHGFWFYHWAQVDPEMATQLHQETSEPPYTLSPLTGLPAPRNGIVSVRPGDQTCFRVTVLSERLEEALLDGWLKNLAIGSELYIPVERQGDGQVISGVRWKVSAHTLAAAPGGLAARIAYLEMARAHLMVAVPPRQWRFEFLTPTTFHAKNTHLPFPLPESLIGSWLRRWQAYSPLALPGDELSEWTRANLAVSAFDLCTRPAREGSRLRVGCVGTLTLSALDMPPYLRACIDLLAEYALYCGSGSHTAQGLGQTRLVSRR